MGNRRNFLKRLSAGIAAGLAAPWAAGLAHAEGLEDVLEEGKDEWERLRKQFVFSKGQTYLNSATLGLMPHSVVAALEDQIHRRVRSGRYWPDPNATAALAAFVGAAPEAIAITHNTTEGINIVAQGVPLRAGDEVIISAEEHVGNAVPWLNRARRDGIKLKVFRPGPTAAETLDRIDGLIGKNTRLIAVPHLTCTTGQKMPVREIAQLARDKGLLSFIDGAHGPGALKLDMRELGVDFYAGCGHKWLCGPAGSGFLYVSPGQLERLESIFVGAYSDIGWTLNPEFQALDGIARPASRYTYGTQSPLQHAGLVAAVKFMQEIGMEKIEARHHELHAYLRQGISSIEALDILTPAEKASHGAMLSFKDDSKPLESYLRRLNKDNIRIRVVKEGGWNAIRISPHIFTLPSDLDRAVASIRQVAEA